MATKKASAADVTAPIDAAVAAGLENFDKAVKTGRETMEKIDVDQAVKTAREQFDTACKTVFGAKNPVTEFNMNVFDAYTASVEAFMTNVDAMVSEMTAFGHKSVENAVSNSKTIMACKTVNEAFDRQGELARSGFDAAIAEGAKLAEMSLKTANDTVAPLQNQATEAMTKMFRMTPA